ncbi:hypothetical protein T310_1512 [Rasamsonia emersonii CBS 393.64]|uniref:Uncharacterized protein n=1 Tax=Rasamsonia emersonii (strain ATCC 16479 / CBS 393.64 / IMI 116815) TaxID=1408163 RepID=A0A0F4Z3L8_RASE3|nr:hypothetical protein T310_1512 [Rasamsonia emersonii CBS 393.64]KKA24483.1 hypothetical protein T310_1512 [Rasamsonia emersonii CBS 393.64]
MISRRKRKQVRNPDWQEKKSTRVKVQRVVSDGMRVNPLAHNHNHNPFHQHARACMHHRHDDDRSQAGCATKTAHWHGICDTGLAGWNVGEICPKSCISTGSLLPFSPADRQDATPTILFLLPME